MRSNAKTVEDYLAELPENRRQAIEQVRRVILANLPADIEEAMNWEMIAYQVPLSIHPDTCNRQPLMYAALASQKNHMAVYLTSIYMDPETQGAFEREYKSTGKRHDVGKSCVRFRHLDDLPLDLIGRAIGQMTTAEFVEAASSARIGRS